MALIDLKDVRLALGGPPLLDGVSLQIGKGERICLLGRNGEGKSTLLRILHGKLAPGSGRITRAAGVRIAALPQNVPAGLAGSALEVASAPGPEIADDDDRPPEHAVAGALTRLDIRADDDFGSLSTGARRRVLLAGALARDPDLLLLDEPTNHRDIEAIAWLEEQLARRRKALVFVTHDRRLVRRLATRILELDRGRIFDWKCDYDTFAQRRDDALDAEAAARVEFDKKLAQEEAWIRRGVRERRTRNEGRVRKLMEMREIRGNRRERLDRARIHAEQAGPSGRRVLTIRDVGFGYGDHPVIRSLHSDILRGDRVGIVGPNGSGKTTLLRLLLGELEPNTGTIRLGTGLKVAYFDQQRDVLDETLNVRENVAGGADILQLAGGSRHVIGYLQDFLFTPDRAHAPITALSGGERNRLLLARLFAKPANLLILDEPTNDLDIETLELLEELLLNYEGTVLVVSHDRDFLDNVVTSTLAFAGDGVVEEHAGGYSDWERVRDARRAAASGAKAKTKPARDRRERPRKALTWKEERELEALPARIEALEGDRDRLHGELADPALYQGDGAGVAARKESLAALEADLAAAYARWEDLESKRDQA